MSGEADVSGVWDGSYSYGGSVRPYRFRAEMSDHGGRISGVIEEAGDPAFRGPMSATLSGSRDGRQVRFTKIYDSHDEWLEPIAYDGELSAEGDEIAGRWTIGVGMSGPFVMVRPRPQAAEVEETAEATL